MSENRRLYRKTDERVIGGVAAGLAEYLAVEPSLVRIAFVIAALFNGLGALIYLVMWLVVPAQGIEAKGDDVIRANWDDMRAQASQLGKQIGGGGDGRSIFGVLLLAVGVLLFAREFIPAIPGNVMWPLALIGVGVYIMFRQTRS